MKYSLLLIALLALPANAFAQTMSVEGEAMTALLASCFDPMSQNKNPAEEALHDNLPELPAPLAEKLAQKGGRAFVIRPGMTIMAISTEPKCSIFINTISFANFKKEAEVTFGEASPFKISAQHSDVDSVSRQYIASVGSSDYLLTIDAQKKHEDGRVQGILTLSPIYK